MREHNDGGAAFSGQTIVCNGKHGTKAVNNPGMSLRDYFAAKALAGLLACGPHDCEPEGIAHDAYLFADAMIAQRDREGSA